MTDSPRDRGVVDRYLNRASLKVRLAEYHLDEFERSEGNLTAVDLYRAGNEPFVPVEAHADGVVLQLSAAFDAFACAVAHRYSMPNAERASFRVDRWHAALVEVSEEELAVAIRAVHDSPESSSLDTYRNLAAHRALVGEQIRAAEGPEGVPEVLVLLPEWLPDDSPDFPGAVVGPILRRHVEWARSAIDRLIGAATSSWGAQERNPSREEAPAEQVVLRGGEVTLTESVVAPSPEDLSPTFEGGWRAWFSHGSYTFGPPDAVDPPCWFLRRVDGPALRLDAAGLSVEELRGWIEQAAGADTAREVLRFHRPRDIYGTTFGQVLVPDHRSG